MSPVTQVAEVAVKRASQKGAPMPSLVEMGRQSRRAPARMMAAKPRVITWAGVMFLSIFEKSPIVPLK